LTIEGEQSRRVYKQSFDQAYIGRSPGADGEYDVVLLQQPQKSPTVRQKERQKWDWSLGLTGAPKAKPLHPVNGADELQQVVHIHVFWKGQGGSVARDGMVTNSAIDWYVIGHGSPERRQLIKYEGAAYVLMKERAGAAGLDLRDGRMRKKESIGFLSDPIGNARLFGSIDAVHNDQIVRSLLAELENQTTVAATDGQTSETR
jgi:hypothetical protein